jgi:heme o synthase
VDAAALLGAVAAARRRLRARRILIYTLILAPVGVAPTLFGFAGLVYGAVALVCGVVMLALAWRVFRDRTGPAAATAARKLFAFSLLYVVVLFAALLADNLLARLGWLS